MFSYLASGRLLPPPPSHPGSITDIMQYKFNATYKLINPATEENSLDKGFEGAQDLSPSRMPSKRGKKRTMEEKLESNKLKRQCIIYNCFSSLYLFLIIILTAKYRYNNRELYLLCQAIQNTEGCVPLSD
jgi:hypothetical protein